MGTMNALAWLLPVLFMFHDFEEIIFIHPWLVRNKEYMKKAHAESKKVPFDFFVSNGSAALCIYEEFIILSVATLLSCIFNDYVVWYGLFVAFTVHLIIHLLFIATQHRYVPGVITSAVVLIPSIYVLYISAIMTGYTWYALSLSGVLVFAFMILNLMLLHQSVKAFDGWLRKFSGEK